MDKLNLILLILTSAIMFAKSDEILSSSTTEVPTTAVNNQNMKNYTSVPSTLTATEEETSTSSSVINSGSTSENQLKVSNLITTTPAAVQTSQEAVTTRVADVTTEIASSSHVDLITTTTMQNEQDESTVVSFGIRSFTVEVSKGDEKLSTEQPTMLSTMGITQTTLHESSVSEKSLDTTSASTTTSTAGAAPHPSSLLKSNLNILFSDEGNNESNDGDDTETTVLLSSHENEIANEIQIDKKLDNGLYRIKIGEITTDEFANGLNFNEPLGDKLHHGQQSKVNIDDFFPSKIEDFRPIIEISNEKMLKEKDALHNEEVVLREEIILNEEPSVEAKSGTRINTSNVGTTNIEIELIDDTSDGPNRDEITTRVEEIVTEVPKQEFIPVRSKKFDPKSNTQGPARTHDFAMTKFTQKKVNLTQNQVGGKPEYSTTKFYNSKELYNEILHKTSKGASGVATTIKPNVVREKLLSTNRVPIDASRLVPTTSEPMATTVTSTTPQRLYTTHPRVISRLEEKLNQLDCDIQNLSADSQVWRGNETHELNLPIKVSCSIILLCFCAHVILAYLSIFLYILFMP